MPVGFPWTQQAITRTSPSLALLEWDRDLMHGLGGAKENFHAAFQSAALAHCDLLALDFPGTGPADFDPTKCADVSTLADLTHLVWNKLLRPEGHSLSQPVWEGWSLCYSSAGKALPAFKD
jgi:pimeloyl-ACP methyl ester carboxylesterase